MHPSTRTVVAGIALAAANLAAQGVAPATESLHAFTLRDIDGQEVFLARYKGKVLLVVNVASRCGFTKQYADLEALHQRFKDRGFAVLGIPSNDFGSQEPGTDAEIKEFCSTKFAVTFPMFSKVSVKGPDQVPLYAWLTDKALHPGFGGPIGWNFTKFLIGADGRIAARFGSRTAPLDAELVQAVETALGAATP